MLYLWDLHMPTRDKPYSFTTETARAAQKKRTSREKALSAVRSGQAEPWRYGPYRIVITRRVTEEEQISVECYEPTRERAIETYGAVMAAMRDAMIAHNEKVVLVHQSHLQKLDRMVERRGEVVRELDERIEKQREWLRESGAEVPDAPGADGEDDA